MEGELRVNREYEHHPNVIGAWVDVAAPLIDAARRTPPHDVDLATGAAAPLDAPVLCVAPLSHTFEK